jgi:hypothetical protein
LVVRLEYGVASDAVEIARAAGRELGRGDYRRLTAAGLTKPAAIDPASDEWILEQVDNDHDKLRVVRTFAASERLKEKGPSPVLPLEVYQS